MSNIVIATGRPIDEDGTITTGNEVSDLPATNLAVADIAELVWRTTDLNNVYVKIQFDYAVNADVMALVRTNASASAQARVRAAGQESDLTSNPTYDSGLFDVWGLSDRYRTLWDWIPIWWYEAGGVVASGEELTTEGGETLTTESGETLITEDPGGLLWWRIDISDSNNSDGYFQAGRLILDDSFQPSINATFGSSVRWRDNSEKRRSVSNQVYIDEREQYREARYDLNALDETEVFDQVLELQRRTATSKDLLVNLEPDNTSRTVKQAIYGYLVQLDRVTYDNPVLFKTRMQIEEAL